ncbi:MAG: hypothetical protein ACI9HK_005170 [Pirellulaceae bacterium]|jgi:hypothetical protein
MSFANPFALQFGWLAVALLAVYLIGLLPKKSNVAAEPIWKATFDKQPRWNQWRKFASLLFHLLAFAAIVLAAADLRWYNDTGRPVVVIIDVSASTINTGQPNSGQPNSEQPNSEQPSKSTRFQSIYKTAWQLIEKRPRLQKMAILAVGSSPRWQCPFTTDQDVLREAIPKQPTHGATSMQTAVDLLQDVRIDGEKPRIIIVGDGCYPLDDETVEQVEQLVVGESVNNYGITGFALRRVAGRPGTQNLALEIANNSSESLTFPLSVAHHSNELFSREVQIAPGEKKIASFDVHLGDPVTLRAKLGRPDGFALDNAAHVAFAPYLPLRIRVLGEQRWTVAAQSLRQYEILSDAEFDVEEEADVTVIVGRAPAVFPTGKVLVFDPAGSSPLWNSTKVERWTSELIASPHDELFKGLRIDNAAIDNYFDIEFTSDPSHQILTSNGRPIVSYLAGNNVIVFHFGIDSADLIKRGEFAVLVDNAIQQLVGGNNRPSGSFSTSDIVVQSQFVAQNRTDEAGSMAIETLQIFGQIQTEPIPIDLLNLLESNMIQIQQHNLTVNDITLGRMLSLSPALLLLAIVLLTLEWRCFQRRQLI